MRVIKNEKAMVEFAKVSLPLNKAIILTGNSTATAYDSLRRNGSFYQVPVGKKLIVVALRAQDFSGAASGVGFIGYGDNTVANSGPAPSNKVDFSLGGLNHYIGAASGAYGIFESPLYFEVPAGKYLWMYGGASSKVTVMGYLVDV